MSEKLFTIKEASEWATSYLKKEVKDSNISYLIQYGKLEKLEKNGTTYIRMDDLLSYYESFHGKREVNWREKLGEDLIWDLSFDNLTEKETTKHVHRLHPYKGKFIPQLVEYFIDNHTDHFKNQVYFKPGDIILDPFCGSGTTLVQANEEGIHAVGLDISEFNSLISNVKVKKQNLNELKRAIDVITYKLNSFSFEKGIDNFDKELSEELSIFNSKFFPSPDFRYKASRGEINEKEFGIEKEKEFLTIYYGLIEKYKIELNQHSSNTFLEKWYMRNTLNEIEFIKNLISEYEDKNLKDVLRVILSRATRSCRATTHSDLATLKNPQTTTYYCVKHKQICKPLFSIRTKWKTYSMDTLKRYVEFDGLRTNTFQICLTGDSRTIDILDSLRADDKEFWKISEENLISGIFSSPPYVGVINYHEQHEYSYDLFQFERRDNFEIGPLFKGQGKEAKMSYVEGISQVLVNCQRFLKDDFNIFLVANDKYNLYPEIAEKSKLQIINRFKRPVLNRTERDKGAYAEIIFHLKKS